MNLSLSVVHFFSSAHREHTEQSVPYRSNVQAFKRSLPFKSVQRTTKRTAAKPLLSNTLNAFERIKFAVQNIRTTDNGQRQFGQRTVNASEHIDFAVQMCRASVQRSVSWSVPQLQPRCETFPKKSDLKFGIYSEIASDIFSNFPRIGLETR